MKKYQPIPGTHFRAGQIFSELKLQHAPILCTYALVGTISMRVVFQTSHLSTAQLLSIQGFAESLWCYPNGATSNNPIFIHLLNHAELITFADIEPELKSRLKKGQKPAWWITPKGFPLSQHFSTNRSTVSE